jgi:flagellar motor component MotA
VTLGLIGNVVGFILALQNIDTGSLGTAEGVQKVAASLLAGMGVAFCSTLVGAVAALWISVNAWVIGK